MQLVIYGCRITVYVVDVLLIFKGLLVSQRHVELTEVLRVNIPERVQCLLVVRVLPGYFETFELFFKIDVSSHLLKCSLRSRQRLLNGLLHQKGSILRILKLTLCH